MKRSDKGFTLIELMVVIVIMGVLAVLAIPKLTDVITKAKIGEIPIVLGSWEHAQMAYIAEQGQTATTVDALAFDGAGDSKWFVYSPSGGGTSDATYSAKVANGKNVGPFQSDAAGPSTTISPDSKVTRSLPSADTEKWKKYLPNFASTTSSSGGETGGETGGES